MRRSQMAAAFFNKLADPAQGESTVGGTAIWRRGPSGAVAVMQEEGVDLDLSGAPPRGKIARPGKNSRSIDSGSSCSQAFSAVSDLLCCRMAARAGARLNGGDEPGRGTWSRDLGTHGAAFLRKWLRRDDEVSVVSPKPTYNWIPSNIWVGVGLMSPADVVFPLAPVYGRHGIEFKQARAVELHPEGRADDPAPYLVTESTRAMMAVLRKAGVRA